MGSGSSKSGEKNKSLALSKASEDVRIRFKFLSKTLASKFCPICT